MQGLFGVGINAILNEAGKSRPTAGNGGPQVVRNADPQVFAVQEQLAALGYDVGRPDGVSGPRTIRAISDYQTALGEQPSGALTATQMSRLMSGDAPAPRTATLSSTGPGMGTTLLPDTDLPGNDYRSGMTDPALDNISASGCQALCEADNQCRAFTHNVSARVCFLKAAASEPAGFSGAISGIKDDFTAAAQSTSRTLVGAEIAELQAGLNALGYDAGAPDGVPGSRTSNAVTSFLADYPGLASARLDTALLTAVLDPSGVGASPSAQVFDPGHYRPLDDALERDLALIALALGPSRIEDRRVLDRWFTKDHLAGTRERDAYRSANSVEQAAMLDQFGAQILQEAQAFLADPANKQIRVRIGGWVSLGDYDPDRGIALGKPDMPIFVERRFDQRIDRIYTSYVGVALDMPETFRVEVADEAAASAFLDRADEASGHYVAMTAWLTLSNFGDDRNAPGAASARTGEIEVTVAVDRVTLQSVSRQRSDQPDDQELALLFERETVPQPQRLASDSIAMAREFGLPILDGHLVLVGNRNAEFGIKANTPRGDYYGPAARFFNLGALGMAPELAEDQLGNEAILRMMSANQRIRIFGQDTTNTYGIANEFERRRALAVYNDQVLPELLARTPSFPIPAVILHSFTLGDYSFSRAAFPINGSGSPQDVGAFMMPPTISGMKSVQPLLRTPSFVSMDEGDAEAFVQNSRGYERPSVTMASFGTLDLMPNGTSLTFTADHMGIYIYRDGLLAEQLAELDPGEYYASTSSPAAPDSDTAAPDNTLGLPLLAGTPLLPPVGAPGYDATRRFAALLMLRADFSRWRDPDQTMAYAKAIGIDLDPYLSDEAATQWREDKLNPVFDSWAGDEPYLKQNTHERFLSDQTDAVRAMLPTLPMSLAIMRPVTEAAFDASKGGYAISVPELSDLTAPDGPVRAYIQPGFMPSAVLRMPAETASGFGARIRQDSGRQPDLTYLGGLGLDGDDLILVSQLTITELSTEIGVTLHVTDRGRTLYHAASLTAALASIPPVDPDAAPVLTAEEQQTRQGSADMPAASFDILGVKLGMDLAEARTLLERRFEGRTVVPLQNLGGGGSTTACRQVQQAIDRELAVAPKDQHEAILASHAADQLKHECPATILQFAFGFDVELEDGMFDRIVVLQAVNSGRKVGAVVRSVPPDLSDAMRQGLEDKFGSDYYRADENDQIWLDPGTEASFHQDQQTCTPRWSSLDLPTAYMTGNCGALVRRMNDKVMLVDTRYNMLQYQAIIARLAAAEAAKEPIRIEF